MNINEFFKQKRESNGWTLSSTAKKLNIAPSTLSRIESGETKTIKNELFANMLEVFNVPKNERASLLLDNHEYIEYGIENIFVSNSNYNCNVCGKDEDALEINIGRNNQLISVSLCKNHRKDLIFELLNSLDKGEKKSLVADIVSDFIRNI